MRYGVFSDVHSNQEALEAVLAALQAERVDRLLCGGDLVGYAAAPERCVVLVREACDVVVAGNHDWAAVGKFPMTWFHQEAQAALAWTSAQLSSATQHYLAGLPLVWHDDQVTLAHGTLHEPEAFHYLFDTDVAAESFYVQRTPVAFVGHTHVPIVFMNDAQGHCRLLRGARIHLTAGAQYLVNVGSVGQPRDQQPHAAYCVYDTDRRTLAFTRVPYAIPAVQAKIRAAGLPGRFADRLAWGG